MGVLSVRLDKELEEKIEFLMKKRKIVDKSAYIRQMLDRSIKSDLIDVLCSEVRTKQISTWKAAEIAQISLRAFLKELSNREISIYNEEELKEDLDFL